MGMFDKDKVFAPDGAMDKWVSEGDRFIVFACEVKDRNFQWGSSEDDTATMVHWTVAALDAPENKAVVSTIGSAMAEKADSAEDGDLPAVVVTDRVESDKGNPAYVMKFVEAYEVQTKAKAK